jgi:small-conductance mechanosensitive channel
MEHALLLAWHTIKTTIDAFFLSLPNIIVAIFVFAAFLFGAKYAQTVVLKLTRKARLDPALSVVLGSLTRLAVSIAGFLVAAVVVLPGFSPASLVAGLGVTSVAIGFAFQDILKNFFAGILLLWQKPFRVGDEIKTGDYEGKVEEINIRATILRMYSGESVVLPNGKIYSDPIIVLTSNNKRRVHLTLKLDVTLDFDIARPIILDVLGYTEGVLQNPQPHVYLGAQDGSNNQAEIYFWSAPENATMLAVRDRVSSEIRRKLHVARIEASEVSPSEKNSGSAEDKIAESQTGESVISRRVQLPLSIH